MSVPRIEVSPSTRRLYLTLTYRLADYRVSVGAWIFNRSRGQDATRLYLRRTRKTVIPFYRDYCILLKLYIFLCLSLALTTFLFSLYISLLFLPIFFYFIYIHLLSLHFSTYISLAVSTLLKILWHHTLFFYVCLAFSTFLWSLYLPFFTIFLSNFLQVYLRLSIFLYITTSVSFRNPTCCNLCCRDIITTQFIKKCEVFFLVGRPQNSNVILTVRQPGTCKKYQLKIVKEIKDDIKFDYQRKGSLGPM